GRARLMQGLPAGGAMVALGASEGEVEEALREYAQTVSLAAVNGPKSVVIAGVEGDVEAGAGRVGEGGVATKRLAVSHAFHSALMEPMLEEFREVAESIRYEAARIGVVTDTRGELSRGEVSTAEYWVRHVREAVRFGPAVEELGRAGVAC